MYDFLKQHAIANVWCSPEQDNQVIVAAARISRPIGEYQTFNVMTRRLSLPTKTTRYHVFQIGQAHPSILGLLPRSPDWAVEAWTLFSDAVNNLNLICDLYADSGVHLPLHRAYYMYTNDRALIFAIDASGKSPIDYATDQVYLRLYSNAYYESAAGLLLTNPTRTSGRTIVSTDNIVTLQSQINALKALPGKTLCFVNGGLVDGINLFTTQVGDVVEYTHDSSIKRVVDLQVKDLLTFQSTLDSCYKYLLHYPETGTPQIDYLDDIDVYIVQKTGDRVKGRFFHRNQSKSVRMVTHRDYAIPVDAFESIASRLAAALSTDPLDQREFYVRLYIRQGGYNRPLVYDHQRLFELYKLADTDIVRAMAGIDAVMPYWTADALEASAYTELMRSPYSAITIDLINRSYGYNAISKLIGDMPLATKALNAFQTAILPQVLQAASTIYEYDATGKLLGFTPHYAGTSHIAKFAATRYIEGVAGLGSSEPSVTVGQNNLVLPVTYSYRVYMCYLVDGVPNNAWVDITGSDYYTVVNNTLVWSDLETGQWLMVRTDEKVLTYTVDLAPDSGTFHFELAETVAGKTGVMTVPMGDLDLWLNGYGLIENLDYQVNFPEVVIFNKTFLIQPSNTAAQQITVRFSGFCQSDLTREAVGDYGFIEHGVLSNNNRFDIRDDKVLRITVAGLLRDRADLTFSEQHSGVSIINALNGVPYQVKDVTVPLRALTDDETYALRQASLVVDKAVEDYMTLKLPQPPRDAVSAITARYQLVSPFFCNLINDIVDGTFDSTALDAVLSDNEVLVLCGPYEGLLNVDPLNPALELPSDHVVIHPTGIYTPVGLSLAAYRFMQRVVALYGRGLVTINQHLTVSLGGS